MTTILWLLAAAGFWGLWVLVNCLGGMILQLHFPRGTFTLRIGRAMFWQGAARWKEKKRDAQD